MSRFRTTIQRIFIIMAAAAAISACAPAQIMPLNDKAYTNNTSGLVFGTLTIHNQFKPGHQPKLQYLYTGKDGKGTVFKDPLLLNEVEDGPKKYFLSMSADGNSLHVDGLYFLRNIPVVLSSTAYLPLQTTYDVRPGEALYIGHINATIVERVGDEPRAGSLLPLMDQSITGFSGGKFKVEVEDRYQEDVSWARSQYPVLSKMQIRKSILQNWVHPELR